MVHALIVLNSVLLGFIATMCQGQGKLGVKFFSPSVKKTDRVRFG